MTGEQQDHIKGINKRFTEFNHAKYTAGVKEHKNLLSSLPVTSLGIHALEEVADLVKYLYSLNDNLELIRTRLTALKNILQAEVQMAIDNNQPIWFIEDRYDSVRRVTAIERLLG